MNQAYIFLSNMNTVEQEQQEMPVLMFFVPRLPRNVGQATTLNEEGHPSSDTRNN